MNVKNSNDRTFEKVAHSMTCAAATNGGNTEAQIPETQKTIN